MERFDDDRLTVALESLRPGPSPAFAAELDERAAADFPRRTGASSPRRRFGAWIGSLRPRRVLLPAAATALAAIVAVTVVLAVGENGSGSGDASNARGGGSTLGFLNKFPDGAVPEQSTGTEFSAPVPSTEGTPSKSAGGSATAGTAAPAQTGPYAAGAGHREVERSAEMVLGADPDEVPGAAAKVFDAVHAYDGIVLHSSVSGGAAGEAGADFELLIPSAKLGDALAAFSAVAEVRSRHEATDDITAPTVRVGEQLRDARATIDGLLAQLAGADADAERGEVEAELASERRHAAALRSSLAKLDRRANLSRVLLRIESGEGSDASGSSGAWGVDDALGDAGHILGIAAGVTVIGLAILVPLALIALLAWLAARAWTRRSRDRTLS